MPANGKVIFGATVVLSDEDSGDEVTYQIVGEDESDIKASLISVNSPIARALIGKQEGDVATVQTPGGAKNFEIVEVRYE
jgi:transcription elongation factor GreA